MFICPATVSAQAFVFAIAISLFTVTLSASFPYPQMLHSVSASLPFALFFSAPLLSTIHPLLPFSIFPIIPLFPPSHRPPLSRSPSSPSLPFLLRTDLLSLHWWPWWFSWMVHSLPGASPRPFSAACSCSSTQRWQQPQFFLCGHNDSMAPAAQPRDFLILSYRSQGDLRSDVCFI